MPSISVPQTASVRQSSNSEHATRGPSSGPVDHDWSDFKTGSRHIGQGQGPSETLVQSLTEREMTIRRYDNGVVEIDLKRPDIDRLVLSGGGAKGVAFSGMVKALEQHQALDKIRSIFGSSAGAISAAFLASGMGHADFDKMSDETNLVSLLDSHNKVLGPIQHVSSVIGKGIAKIPGKTGTIGRLLFDLMPRLQSKAVPLEELLHEKMVESIQSRFTQALHDPQQQLSQATKDCVEKININGYVTFGDLATLSKDMPEIKQLHITGTAMFDERPQMVVFNASLTPEMDVARAAHISGSLPVVFQKPSEQGLPFQTDEERTSFQDGGIMLNTPVVDLYEPQFPMSPIPESDQLILKFESGNGGNKKDRGTLTSALADKFVGVNYAARDAQEASGIKAFEKQTIIVPLKTEKGDFTGTLNGTVNFSMPLEHKNNLQQRLDNEVSEYLKRHASSETYTFNSIGGALLTLDDRMFDAAANELQNDPACADVIDFRQQAQQTMANLSQALLEAKATSPDKLNLTAPLKDAINRFDQLGNMPGKIEWLAKKLNHGNVPDYMELLQAVKRIDAETAGPKSVVLTKAIEEMGVRNIKTKSENFIREVISPSLYRLDQPDSNVKVLTRAISDLRESTNPADFNAVLNRIADKYVSRNFPNSSRPFKSTTVAQVRAWLIPDR
ncbi:patatin-like phospholipase family protein [Pseudomonas sp. PGPR40]|uniref:patatin-like phospholipase family protein n=1 Tax=Pseudomonas sp. PGPR40 TaxID=2913476 RepID=UPI001EDC5255|nr:patatin-like phospholipase family protein [Pseudomonas sp. PGPR40]